MSTTTLKFKSGTTIQWEEAKRVLEDREIGLEVTEDLKYILRIGDGKTEFMKLPAVMSKPYFDEACEKVNSVYLKISKFESEMETATEAATSAAENASNAATRAEAATEACNGIAQGMNVMIDDVTKKPYKMGIENGVIYLMEVTKE